jgi:hypothetical protein
MARSPGFDRDSAQALCCAGVTDNVICEVGSAKDFAAIGLDLVTFFDCLQDMGDPVGAVAHVCRSLKKEGSWLIVEPMAADSPKKT